MNTDSAKLCAGIVKAALPCRAYVNCRVLKPYLKKSFRQIKDAVLASRLAETDGKNLSDSFLWLTDNYSFIEEEYLYCLKLLNRERSIASKSGLPLAFDAMLELCRICEGALTEELVDTAVLICDTEIRDGFGFDDRKAYPVITKCAFINYIGSIVSRISQTGSFVSDENDGQKLISAIKSMKKLSIHDFSEAFDRCRLEKILCSDPSGAYPLMDTASKDILREAVNKKAKAQKLSDCDYAEKLLEESKCAIEQHEKYIGHAAFEPSVFKKLYFPFLFCFPLAICLFICKGLPYILFIPLIFPVFDSFKTLLDFLVSKLCRTSGQIPSLKLEQIPDDAKTLCVITALLRGEKFDGELFSRLEKIRCANSEKNIRFGLLCDLGDSDSATKSDDRKTLDYAAGRIDALNRKYGGGFCLFSRPRSYSKSERAFMAYERKRGAVIELVKLIKGEPSQIDTDISSDTGSNEFINGVKYVITLDADTNLGLDAARALVGKMLHPANTPKTDKSLGRVVSGYGILQPRMSSDLDAACATPFSRLMCGNGGTDIYSGACFDLYQSVFGTGIFCGKGIFDVDAFYETVVNTDIFPEDTILSHDIIEGELLRTALLCDTEFTDGFPKNELSFLKRKHRWIRGDIQNIIYLMPYVKNRGKNYKNPLTALSKFKILDNVRRALTPVFSMFLVIYSFFAAEKASVLLAFVFLPYFVPFVLDALNLLSEHSITRAARKFYSVGITVGIWQSFLRMLFFGAMLAKEAFLSFGAVITSLYRMLISRRHLLEWVTAAHSDSGKPTLPLFINKHLISSVTGALLFVFSPGGAVRVCGLAFFVMPLLGYFTSKNRKRKKELSDTDKRTLTAYAADIWRFFSENVGEKDNFLPPDNIQLSPYEKTAHRTSPTNIGLYLTSILAARDFGFIDSAELVSRSRATLETIEKLEKWNGHLFNWYDTTTCKTCGPHYISSVDSGNFAACLITFKNGIAEYASENPEIIGLIAKASVILRETDFRPLFNTKRGLFRVGAEIVGNQVKYDDGCYDFLMSEARILSYVACSRREVPKDHWKKLSRPLITSGGYIGLSSWSGTAFEYFMPNLFMPAKKGCLAYEAGKFAFLAQKQRRAGKVWGISESGFFAFDSELNYQYKAFGVPKLSKKSGVENELVISPYSSFLALCVSTTDVLSNLRELSKLGIYGKYGFYEAADFTHTRVKSGFACVKSYMSHHLGMSLAALSNAALDGAVIRRFMSESETNCAGELLEEKIPVNVVIKRIRHSAAIRVHAEKKRPPESYVSNGYSFCSPKCACISDGKVSLTVSDCGHVRLTKNNIFLCGFGSGLFPGEKPESIFCYVRLDGRIYGLSPLSSRCTDKKFSFSYTDFSCRHDMSCESGKFSLGYTVSSQNHSLVRIKLCGNFEAKKADLRFLFYPRLSEQASHSSHPSFSDLFIEAEYDEKEKILFYKRRKRSKNEQEQILAVAFSDKDKPIVFETRKSYERHSEIFRNPHVLFENTDSGCVGACISPVCVIGSSLSAEQEIFMVMTHSIADAKEAILKERKNCFEDAENLLSETAAQFCLGAGISSVGTDGTVRELLSEILFGDHDLSRKNAVADAIFSENTNVFCRNSLWKHGISGDNPIVLVNTGGFFIPSPLEKRIRAFRLLTMKNIRSDLLIVYREKDKYERTAEKKLLELIRSCGAEGYLGRNCGIHLIEKGSGADMPAFLHSACSYTDIFSDPPHAKDLPSCTKSVIPITHGKPLQYNGHGFSVSGGLFESQNFTVIKELNPRLPWAHVLSGKNISCVLTQNSLGYTFERNASERRITAIPESSIGEYTGERLFLCENGVVFDLAACSSHVSFSCGKAEYYGKVSGVSYTITVFCDAVLPTKAIVVKLDGKTVPGSSLVFRVNPCMGRKAEKCISKTDGNTVLFRNPLSDSFSDYTGFISVYCEGKTFCSAGVDILSENTLVSANTVSAECEAIISKNTVFVIGAYKNKSGVLEKTHSAFSTASMARLEQSEKLTGLFIPRITMTAKRNSCESESTVRMFNTFLPYSTAISRMLARSGYYQSGGAFGFRDQLQDSVAVMYASPDTALVQIIRSAAHQFPEGDVLHWWHSQGEKGVRTMCSDDYLWLIYAVCEYIAFTGKHEILDIEIPYIEGEKLSDGMREKYIPVSKSNLRESLYKHCKRAFERATKLIGPHGLCLIGSCDWCDGYSLVGKDGKGESVWLSMFLCILADRFESFLQKNGDTDDAERYNDFANKLRQAIISHGFDSESGYFIRGYYDDGTVLGGKESEEGKIDLLPQAFSALSGLPDDMCKSALEKAVEILWDDNNKIMRLLYPPFDKTEKEPGYIKGYIPGVRENGGQYTHGAMFACLGLSRMSRRLEKTDKDRAKKFADATGKILLYSNPAFRASGSAEKHIRENYLTEPYSVAADIYANKDHPARGGWTHYTGANGWMWRLLLSEFLGLEFRNTEKDGYIEVKLPEFSVMPNVIDGLCVDIKDFGFDMKISYAFKDTQEIIADGKKLSENRLTRDMKKIRINLKKID